MYSLVKKILKSGHWAQCKFCNGAYPTKEYAAENIDPSRIREVIEPSGYCSYCVKVGLAK